MPAADHPPSFQFYPRDFLSDRAVALMSPEARGGYITLLCHAWLSDEPGILPDDDATLAQLSGLGDRWSSCSVSIRRAFRQTSREGMLVLVQARMKHEREHQLAFKEQASLGGVAAARKMSSEQKIARARAAANARWNAKRMLSDANTSSASASRILDSKDRGCAADSAGTHNEVNSLISGIATKISPAHPRATLMARVRAMVASLPPAKKNRIHAFAGWLAKSGVEDECILRFTEDAIPRMDSIRSLQAYYAKTGPARATIEGNYRADLQDRESKRWKDEEWEWVRRFRQWEESIAP